MPAPPRKAPDFPIRPILEFYGIHVGRGGKALCAWHEDSRPSLSVTKYGYKCWSCGASGDALKLIREREGVGHQAAIARAEEITRGSGHPVSQTDRGEWGGQLLA